MVQLADLVLSPIGEEEFAKILTEWNAQNAKKFSFPDIAYTQRKPIFSALFAKLNDEKAKFSEIGNSGEIAVLCLQTIRILCREKLALDDSFSNENDVWLLFDLAYLRQQDVSDIIPSVRTEALKCLCNVIFNCPAVQVTCRNAEIVKAVIKNLEREAASTPGDAEIVLLSSKILFLITGFNPSMRTVAFQNGAIGAICNFLTPRLTKNEMLPSPLTECIIEALKAVFNVASSIDVADATNRPAFDSLADFLRQVLLIQSGRIEEICFQAVALMTLLPQPCFARLITVTPGETAAESGQEDMPAIDRVLDHFDYVLTNHQANIEHVVPTFVALTRMSRSNRIIRHYTRSRVLPPLTEDDVRRLPQEGSTTRNRICRLLTSTNMEVKEHAADFLFVLCKENVHRFIKYTGFGNAAGLLANHGLLGKVAGRHANENGEAYSGESGEEAASDTEDYRNVRGEVNPVTGRVDPPLSRNPFEGMTDEQKEYEAMQLVNAIDRLQRQGLIQPVQLAGPSLITNSGGPQRPIQHVLQLRDEFLESRDLNNSNNDNKEEDDDEN